MRIDLNCDMGEGMPDDEALMPLLSSANISCGYHAGDEATLRATLELARHYGVNAGAHVSFPDRENFGRTEMNLPPTELYACVVDQLQLFDRAARSVGVEPVHVKPHGALYNQSARDPKIAQIIARAVRDTNPRWILFGLSGSDSIREAQQLGLSTASEVFADRSYQDDGSLTPRKLAGAMIENTAEAIAQVLLMIRAGRVRTLSGKEIPIVADTVCLHGDGPKALIFARALVETLHREQISIIAVNQ